MNRWIVCWLAFLTTAACSVSPEVRYYTLSAAPAGSNAAAGSGRATYSVDAVAIPDLLDRPQIVMRAGPNGADVLDDDRWIAPLPDLLRRVLAADLSARLGAGAVIEPGLPSGPSVRRIAISILEFDTGSDGQSVLDASWTISDSGTVPEGGNIETHRVRHVASTDRADLKNVVATMNRLLPALADDILASLPQDQ
jgi:hypothetical protein